MNYFLSHLWIRVTAISHEQMKCRDTYKCYDFIEQEITNKCSQYIKNNFNIALNEVIKCLPSIRFIIAPPVSSLKHSSKSITYVLKGCS